MEEFEEINVDTAAGSNSVDAAVRHLHALILQDLRPPWIDESFPQALPGDATVSRYSRPTFLYWEPETARVAVGESIVSYFTQRCERVDLTFAGIVGRPVYACTARSSEKPESICGAMASMSPLLSFPGERKEWRCANCLLAQAPVSDSVPRRILRLYPLVRAAQTTMTSMRTAPMLLYVFVPPECFTWGQQHVDVATAEHAAPQETKIGKSGSIYFQFSQADSDRLWLSAKPYKRSED
jgi:hypothetical protein